MSKNTDPIVEAFVKAEISYEDDPFTTSNVRYGYHESDHQFRLEGRINSERKILQIFCATQFDITKTYRLVPHSPKDGEAQLVYIRPSPFGGRYNFRSDSGELQFVAEASGLHGFFKSFSAAVPDEFPDTDINGSFRVYPG
ncbi:hypothetical protein [Pseudomonas pergaminensis]|nr:hypothetical protein [Pseudomonas sp.]